MANKSIKICGYECTKPNNNDAYLYACYDNNVLLFYIEKLSNSQYMKKDQTHLAVCCVFDISMHGYGSTPIRAARNLADTIKAKMKARKNIQDWARSID